MEPVLNINHKRQQFILKWSLIAISCVLLYLLAFNYLIDKRPFVEWTLIKGGSNEEVPESQLIKMPDGKVFLINAGDASGSLLPYLKKQKIKDVDLLILTSTLPKAISGIHGLINTGVRIKEIRTHSFLSQTTEWENLKTLIQSKSIIDSPLESEEILYRMGATEFRFISKSKDLVLLKMLHGTNKVLLMLGDASSLNHEISQMNCEDLKVDILLNYLNINPSIKSSMEQACSHSYIDLSREMGTFKILLKGDSFKWKRGR